MLDKAAASLMLDYYGPFLTQRQAELMRMSADEDMSLSEIAEQVGVSRQAVRDHLSKASKELELMEERLQRLEDSIASGGDIKAEAENAVLVIRSVIR